MKESNRSSNSGRDSREKTMIALPPRWLVLALVVLTLPWFVVAAVFVRSGPAEVSSSAGRIVAGERTPAAAGPWGRLTTTPIVVSPPLEYVAADWGRQQAPYRWYFPGTSPETLRAFLSSTGLSPDQIARLESTVEREERIAGLTIRPDLNLLQALDPAVRARLYLRLARSPLNADHGNSFRFFGSSTGAWFGGSPIAPETRTLIEPLVYRDGDVMHFADSAIVHGRITDRTELQRLAKVLLRQPTVLVRLAVDQSSEISALAEYWGRGGRSTDVRPLLESVAGAGAAGEIDIVHLLPAFARNRLYRYPKLTAGDLNKPALANCLWTALNFFAQDPDDRFLDVTAALATLRRDYYIVESNYQLGDVIALLDAEGDLFHVVVYLADDLVFTKNGTSPVSPWTIMPLQRVKEYYRNQSDNPRLIYHRRSDL